jgi:Ni2+-binding GTPase involved in maturation of urease and hydrogenase
LLIEDVPIVANCPICRERRHVQSIHRVAAQVGDLTTENDAARLARSQATVKQIITGTVCHLKRPWFKMLWMAGF